MITTPKFCIKYLCLIFSLELYYISVMIKKNTYNKIRLKSVSTQVFQSTFYKYFYHGHLNKFFVKFKLKILICHLVSYNFNKRTVVEFIDSISYTLR